MRPDFVRTRRTHWFTGLVAVCTLAVAPPATPPTLPAPHTAKIEGTVLDQAGSPIPSAQVRIDGTAFGGTADSRGYYFINDVPAGTYDLTGTFVGFRPVQVRGLRVLENSPVTQNFTLTASPVDIGDIEIVSASNALVPREEVVTKQRIKGEFTEKLPVDKTANVLELQPGVVVNRDGGLNIKGGRDDEKATYIDGVPVSPGSRGNTFGGIATGGSQVTVSPFADPSVTATPAAPPPSPPAGNPWSGANTEEYHRIYDNRFKEAASNPLSTFSIDVDAASYSNTRRFLTSGQAPVRDAVRIEEFINYFDYPYEEPSKRQPFSVTLEENPAPWAPDHRLVLIGLHARRIPAAELPPSNLVFLIDVSGSMGTPDKLPLVKRAFQMLVRQIREEDRVAIVVYAGAAGLVLPSTPGSDRETIAAAIDRLQSGGSTAGGAGIQLAYRVAAENFMPSGNNRVILATDGDFNVGASSESELVRMIEEYREQGTFLTVLGFGTGNLKDARMEQLADKGNGNYAYVDNDREARKVFVNQLGGTLFTVAKDVKLQVEFNPARVAQYRLIGYENRVMAKEDFADDRKDAGDMGAGHSVTALYEIVPTGAPLAVNSQDTLRYQFVSSSNQAKYSREWLTVKLRYKRPNETRSRLFQESLATGGEDRSPSETFRFASAVAEFGMLLRNSEYRGSSASGSVIERAESAIGDDVDGTRREFVDLVRRWETIARRDRRD